MDRTLIAGLGLLGVLAAPAWAQEGDSPPRPDVKQLIEQLGDPSYKTRKSAEEALRARGDEARSALQQAAEKSEDPEVRWRAQRLLRASEAPEGLRRRALDRAPGSGERSPPPGLEHRFDDLFGRLERDFGIDVPRHRFFGEEFFRDLDEQMQDMRRGLDIGGSGQSQSMQMQVGPGGVSVKIKERNDQGDLEDKTYEADDMDSFRDKYPDIARRYFGDGGGLRWNFAMPRGGLPQAIDGHPRLRGRLLPRGAPASPPAVADDGPKLGVMVQELSPDVGEFLGLEEGQGLVVQEVLDGSLAETIELRQGDVVLQVNGRKVFGVEDVAAALSQKGDEVEVEVSRRGQAVTLSGQKPAPKNDDADSGGKLKKRAAGDKPQIR